MRRGVPVVVRLGAATVLVLTCGVWRARSESEPTPSVAPQGAPSAAPAPAAEPEWRQREREQPLRWGATGPAADEHGEGVPWARLVSGMFFVLALACGGVWVLKRLGGRTALNRGRYLEVLESRAVSRRMRLVLVRVAGRVILLAGEGEHASVVTEFGEEELPEPERSSPPAPKGFRPLLRRLSGAAAGGDAETGAGT